MTPPLLEVADIVRAQGDRFIQHHFRWIHWAHRKVLRAIARCRTAALGGHRDKCPRCGYRTTSYNSCRDRHCPKCQSGARDKWIMARQNELLPVAYVHVVFTLPQRERNPGGSFTQNGLFAEAARKYKLGAAPAERVKVYEKIRSGIWVYNGLFELVDCWTDQSESRKAVRSSSVHVLFFNVSWWTSISLVTQYASS